jgi:hypothetical protein
VPVVRYTATSLPSFPNVRKVMFCRIYNYGKG